MNELLANFESQIEAITLIPSKGGAFELLVNGDLLYSKLATGRHVENGEVVDLVNQYLQKGRK